jgi:hypothetical protein
MGSTRTADRSFSGKTRTGALFACWEIGSWDTSSGVCRSSALGGHQNSWSIPCNGSGLANVSERPGPSGMTGLTCGRSIADQSRNNISNPMDDQRTFEMMHITGQPYFTRYSLRFAAQAEASRSSPWATSSAMARARVGEAFSDSGLSSRIPNLTPYSRKAMSTS